MQSIFGYLANEIDALVKLKQGEQKLFLVGGVIRDFHLGKRNRDIDVLCNFDTRLIARKFADLKGGAFFMLDEQRNTSRAIVVDGNEKINYDFARLQGDSLLSDLSMRDFTMNAMAIDLDEPEVIIDPLGGCDDLEKKVLRDCSPTSFFADPVRVIRAVRYSVAYGLMIEDGTLGRLEQNVNLLDLVSGERKRDELFKIVASQDPYKGFIKLWELGILQKVGFPVTLDHSQAGRRVKCMDALIKGLVRNGSENDPWSIWVNSDTREKLKVYLTERNSSDRNEAQLLLLGCALRNLKIGDVNQIAALQMLSREETDKLVLMSTNRMLDSILQRMELPSDRELYRYFRATGETGIDLALLTYVESCGDESEVNLDFAKSLCELVVSFWFEKPETANPVLFLNGTDLMVNFDLTPGPLIGELIAGLREEQAAGMVTNKQQALDWVENHLSNSSLIDSPEY